MNTTIEGNRRRIIAAQTGACPCGAHLTRNERRRIATARKHARIIHVALEHEHDCPAVDENINLATTCVLLPVVDPDAN